MIIILCSLHLCMDSTNIDLLLVDHNHHLPFAFIFTNTSEFRASKGVFTHIMMRPFRLFSNQYLISLVPINCSHNFIFHLGELLCQHILLNLCLQPEKCGCTFVLVVSTLHIALLECSAKITLSFLRILVLLNKA